MKTRDAESTEWVQKCCVAYNKPTMHLKNGQLPKLLPFILLFYHLRYSFYCFTTFGICGNRIYNQSVHLAFCVCTIKRLSELSRHYNFYGLA